MSHIPVEVELTAIEMMALAELRVAWTRRVKTTPPKVSAELLRLALAHWVQSKAFRRCYQGNEAPAPRTGVRQEPVWTDRWHAPCSLGARQGHVVTIMDDQRVHWNGKDWNSLSEVARAITGTRWSGPAFFGLKTRKRAA